MAAQKTKPTKTRLTVSVEEDDAVVRTLRVEVPADRVDAAFSRAYRDLARRVRVKGFRPGKTPRGVLERLYGPAVAEDLERSLVRQTLGEALEQSELRPIVQPVVDSGVPRAGDVYRYSARIELRPDVQLPDLEGLPGRRPKVEVGVADVEGEIEALRQRQASLIEEPEEARAAEGHVLTVDFEGRIDGESFEGGSGKGVTVELGSGRFLPGFEEGLLGAKSGDEREVRSAFPEEDGGPHAGKEALFRVVVKALQRREVPELDDEFAKDLGEFESLSDLRTKIREELEAVRDREAGQALRRSVLDALLDRASFEVPVGLVDEQLERRLARAHRELEDSVPEAALHAQLEKWRGEWRPLAEREVREELALDAVAEAREVEVADEDLDARLLALAGGKPRERQKLRKRYEESGLLVALRAGLAREQALEFLVAEAKVEETTDT